MLSTLKPLLVLALLALIATHLGKRWLVPQWISPERFKTYVTAASLVTLAAFCSFNLWLYMLISSVVVWRLSARSAPAAMLLAVMFCTPFYGVQLGGSGGIPQLFYFRLQHVFIWIAFYRLWAERATMRRPPMPMGTCATDWLVMLWFGYQLVSVVLSTSVTHGIRIVIQEGTETLMVYFILSRAVLSRERLREAMAVFMLMAVFLGLVSAFELVRGWQLYIPLNSALGAPGGSAGYLPREGTNMLRAQTSMGHPIVLGAFLAMALVLSIGLQAGDHVKRMVRWSSMGAIAAGLVATISRGPWLAGFAAYVVWLAFSPNAFKRMMQGAFVLTLLAAVMLVTPQGQKFVEVLPWVGEASSSTVDYRQQLLEISYMVFLMSPWTGVGDYMNLPIMQSLVQGQGIIDIVNTYVAIALSGGVVGLAMFLGIYVSALGALWTHRRTAPRAETSALVALVVCFLLVIATVSTVGVLSVVGLAAVGWSVACSRLQEQQG